MGYGTVNVKSQTQNDYIAEETEIGYLLGKKIYRKLLIRNASYGATSTNIDVTSLNIETLVRGYGLWESSDSQGIIPLSFGNSSVDVIFRPQHNTVQLRSNISINVKYLWIEYTKK